VFIKALQFRRLTCNTSSTTCIFTVNW